MNERLQNVLADTLGLDVENVTPELSRDSEAAWDSMNHLRLITAVEEAFGIKLSMADIQEITTAADLEQRIQNQESA